MQGLGGDLLDDGCEAVGRLGSGDADAVLVGLLAALHRRSQVALRKVLVWTARSCDSLASNSPIPLRSADESLVTVASAKGSRFPE